MLVSSKSGNSYYIPVFMNLTYLEYQQLRLSFITKPKPKPPPKTRDSYYPNE